MFFQLGSCVKYGIGKAVKIVHQGNIQSWQSSSELRWTFPLTFLWNYHTQTNESVLKNKRPDLPFGKGRNLNTVRRVLMCLGTWGWAAEEHMRMNAADYKPSLAPWPSAAWTGITFTHGFAFFTTPSMESPCWDQVQSLKHSVCKQAFPVALGVKLTEGSAEAFSLISGAWRHVEVCVCVWGKDTVNACFSWTDLFSTSVPFLVYSSSAIPFWAVVLLEEGLLWYLSIRF